MKQYIWKIIHEYVDLNAARYVHNSKWLFQVFHLKHSKNMDMREKFMKII